MPEMSVRELIGLAQDAFAVCAVAPGAALGTDIANDKVRRIYKLIITNTGVVPNVVAIWQGDATPALTTLLMTVSLAPGQTVELGEDVDQPLITARPATLTPAVPQNEIRVVGPAACNVSGSFYDVRG